MKHARLAGQGPADVITDHRFVGAFSAQHVGSDTAGVINLMAPYAGRDKAGRIKLVIPDAAAVRSNILELPCDDRIIAACEAMRANSNPLTVFIALLRLADDNGVVDVPGSKIRAQAPFIKDERTIDNCLLALADAGLIVGKPNNISTLNPHPTRTQCRVDAKTMLNPATVKPAPTPAAEAPLARVPAQHGHDHEPKESLGHGHGDGGGRGDGLPVTVGNFTEHLPGSREAVLQQLVRWNVISPDKLVEQYGVNRMAKQIVDLRIGKRAGWVKNEGGLLRTRLRDGKDISHETADALRRIQDAEQRRDQEHRVIDQAAAEAAAVEAEMAEVTATPEQLRVIEAFSTLDLPVPFRLAVGGTMRDGALSVDGKTLTIPAEGIIAERLRQPEMRSWFADQGVEIR